MSADPFSEEEAGGREATRGGIQSLDMALQVLQALARMPQPATLSELARRCDMPPSKVHRYLASFINAGLVGQRHRSGRYELGRGAVELGIAAMGRLDIVNSAADRLEEIVDATGAAVLLAVWGNQGPVVVRWHRHASFVVTSLGLGTTLPLLNSATGRIFMAFGERRMMAARIEEEVARAAKLKLSWPDLTPKLRSVEALCAKLRQAGYAAVDGRFIPGLNAISAPVLNWQGEAEAAITITSGDRGLVDPRSPALSLLRGICAELSTHGASS
ncbi:transcriptional regulator, IclR family [Rhizobiales bacterium GAS113]|nr:transcriptional regulator, IclR family [Rhizobiales bacterium GAS113]